MKSEKSAVGLILATLILISPFAVFADAQEPNWLTKTFGALGGESWCQTPSSSELDLVQSGCKTGQRDQFSDIGKTLDAVLEKKIFQEVAERSHQSAKCQLKLLDDQLSTNAETAAGPFWVTAGKLRDSVGFVLR